MPLKDPVARKAYAARWHVAHRDKENAGSAARHVTHRDEDNAYKDAWHESAAGIFSDAKSAVKQNAKMRGMG